MRLLIILIGSSSLLFAQGPEQARYLLEQVSNKIEKQKNMRFEFKYVLENKEEQIRQETEGKVTLAGDRYKLEFLEIIQLFDGEKIYTIVPENEEITVSTPQDSEAIKCKPLPDFKFLRRRLRLSMGYFSTGYGTKYSICKTNPF